MRPLWAASKPGRSLTTSRNGGIADDHRQRDTSPNTATRPASRSRRQHQRRRGQHQRERRPRTSRGCSTNGLERRLRRPAPVVVEEERAQVAWPTVGGRWPPRRALRSPECESSSSERQQRDRRQRRRRAPAPPREAPPARSTQRSRLAPPAQRRAARNANQKIVTDHHVEARLRVAAEELQRRRPRRAPATGSGPGAAQHQLGQQQDPRDHGKMFVSGHGEPDDEEGAEREHEPARSAPPKRMPSARASRNVPKAATNSLSTAITASDFQNGST